MRKSCLLMKTILALCLCLALPAGTACAEGMHVISSGRTDYLSYACTLPDGRILLTGGKELTENSRNVRAWILCLNPDLTVSWEIVDREEDGYVSAGDAGVLADGTIAVVFTARPYRVVIKFFTQDGQPAGKESEIPKEYVPCAVSPSWLMMYRWKTEEHMCETVLTDWSGKELLRYDGEVIPGSYGSLVRNADELVAAGQDMLENGRAKIAKLDDRTGKALWETVLDRQLPGSDEDTLLTGVMTGDGGYAALMMEGIPGAVDEPTVWKDFIVKFDAEGSVRWVRQATADNADLFVYDLCPWNGMVAAVGTPFPGDSTEGFDPWYILWFDGDGNEPGITELKLNTEDFSVLGRYLVSEREGIRNEPFASCLALIPAEDGIWALVSCYMEEKTVDGYDTGDSVYGSQELVLIQIPEP